MSPWTAECWAWHVVDVRGIFAASFISSNFVAQICVKLLELEPWRERMRAQVPVYLLQREQTADTQISSMSGGDACCEERQSRVRRPGPIRWCRCTEGSGNAPWRGAGMAGNSRRRPEAGLASNNSKGARRSAMRAQGWRCLRPRPGWGQTRSAMENRWVERRSSMC